MEYLHEPQLLYTPETAVLVELPKQIKCLGSGHAPIRTENAAQPRGAAG